ncbi:hypothetical protein [Fulvivirga ligni]|uniref:hypothetical protein n=1 Tax=Fulvivirga ligni TaxID=2904246 RepID=UPI001F48015C|nr:hypothetical protein [Fulvivirga ligni]UII21059.1 hypothetical protein LVD16_24755 [Fulvivirga ligni]
MKKLLLIAVFMIGISLHSQAQTFIASFGVSHSWGVPHRVSSLVFDHYHGYEWVHTKRQYVHGQLFFDVILQQNDFFVELRLDNYGHVVRREYVDYYPLHDHICGSYCGFYSNYYNSHYNNCHAHHHHGHNHVIYSRPATRVVYRQPRTRVVYRNPAPQGRARVESRPAPRSQTRARTSTPERRGRNYDRSKYENHHSNSSGRNSSGRTSTVSRGSSSHGSSSGRTSTSRGDSHRGGSDRSSGSRSSNRGSERSSRRGN